MDGDSGRRRGRVPRKEWRLISSLLLVLVGVGLTLLCCEPRHGVLPIPVGFDNLPVLGGFDGVSSPTAGLVILVLCGVFLLLARNPVWRRNSPGGIALGSGLDENESTDREPGPSGDAAEWEAVEPDAVIDSAEMIRRVSLRCYLVVLVGNLDRLIIALRDASFEVADEVHPMEYCDRYGPRLYRICWQVENLANENWLRAVSEKYGGFLKEFHDNISRVLPDLMDRRKELVTLGSGDTAASEQDYVELFSSLVDALKSHLEVLQQARNSVNELLEQCVLPVEQPLGPLADEYPEA